MKHIGIALLCNMSSAASVVSACILAKNGVEGWGLFLMVAVFLHTTYRSQSDEKPG
jgi:hypothetical protein